MKLLDIMTAPWAIVPAKLHEMRSVYETHMKGEKIDLKELKKAKAGFFSLLDDPDALRGYSIDRGVAVIPVNDVLTKNRTFFSYLFGGTSMRDIGDAFRAALIDPAVHSILLRVDSPGGTVDGTEELATTVLDARGKKPVVALADGMMASAAYWIASGADRICIAGETTEIGSIGVVGTHVDLSKQDEMYGEKWTEITAGKYKRIASMHKPLSDEGRSYLQEQVDEIYRVFVDSLAANRGRSVDQILEAADGRIFIGRKAIEVGLADDMSTYDEIITQLQEDNEMNLDELKTKHADLYGAVLEIGRSAEREAAAKTAETIKKEAFDAGVVAGKTAGIAEGAEAERARIQSVEAVLVPGYEAVIQTAKFDGKTTGSEAAILVLDAVRKDGASTLNKLKADAIPPVPNASAGDDTAKANANLPLEQRAKAEWDKTPALREEFSDSFDAYLAFAKNQEAGRVKILRRDGK